MIPYILYDCPFCGGGADLIVKRLCIEKDEWQNEDFDYLAVVCCKECGARSRKIKNPSKEYAISFAVAAWNNRKGDKHGENQVY